MGSFFSKLSERIRGVKEVRLLMLGLDNAGKTSTYYLKNLYVNLQIAILYKLKFNQTVTTIPTAGFNVECLVHKGIKFHVWVLLNYYSEHPNGFVGCRWSRQDPSLMEALSHRNTRFDIRYR